MEKWKYDVAVCSVGFRSLTLACSWSRVTCISLQTLPTSYLVTSWRLSHLTSISDRLLGMWYQWNFVKSFRWPQRALLQQAGDERSGSFSSREENRAKSATDTLLCAVIRIYLDLAKLLWTSLLILLFWTEAAEFVGNIVDLNWNRNKLHKIHTLTNQHKSPPRLWKAKLPNSQ